MSNCRRALPLLPDTKARRWHSPRVNLRSQKAKWSLARQGAGTACPQPAMQLLQPPCPQGPLQRGSMEVAPRGLVGHGRQLGDTVNLLLPKISMYLCSLCKLLSVYGKATLTLLLGAAARHKAPLAAAARPKVPLQRQEAERNPMHTGPFGTGISSKGGVAAAKGPKPPTARKPLGVLNHIPSCTPTPLAAIARPKAPWQRPHVPRPPWHR